MAEAVLTKDTDVVDETTPSGGYASGEVIQLPDGRAAFVTGLDARTSGQPAGLKTSGQVTLLKTASIVILKGAPLYWDRSANTVTCLKAVAGADFFVGVAVDDATAAATTVVVNLNVKPDYVLDLLRDPADSVVSGDATLTVHPGYLRLLMISTSEVQKVDAMSMNSIPVTIPFIVEGRWALYAVGSDATVDINVGIASGTDATDAGTIAESVFLHLNNALSIFAESDDGSVEVSETDTLVDCVDDVYFDFAFDCRDLENIKIYINGVRVLAATTFRLDSATGPLKLLAHMEKTTGAATGEFRVNKLALRAMDVSA